MSNPPSTRGKAVGRVVLVLIVLVLAFVGYMAFKENKEAPDNAAVGDCVALKGGDDVKVIECADPQAAYKILGRVEDKTKIQFDINSASICKPFAGTQSSYWRGEQGKPGYVLCLGKAR